MSNFTTTTPEQKKRATAGKSLVKKIKTAGRAATYAGSGKTPYKITLDGCTCGDWIRYRKPCKHMFALAYKLQVI